MFLTTQRPNDNNNNNYSVVAKPLPHRKQRQSFASSSPYPDPMWSTTTQGTWNTGRKAKQTTKDDDNEGTSCILIYDHFNVIYHKRPLTQ